MSRDTEIWVSVRDCLRLLSARDRRHYWFVVAAQSLTSLLDLAGVLLIGLVGLLAVSTSTSSSVGTMPPWPVSYLEDITGMRPAVLAVWLAVAAAAFFLVKSIASVYLIDRNLRFLAARQVEVTGWMGRDLLASPMLFQRQRTSQETAYALTNGVAFATVIMLGALAIVIGETALLVLLSVALLAVDPLLSLVALLGMFSLAWTLQRRLGRRANATGLVLSRSGIESTTTVQDTLGVYRELYVLGRRETFLNKLLAIVETSADAQAKSQLFVQIPKFVFEAALILGAVALAATQWSNESPETAVATIAVFLAAGSRVMPSLLRLQSSTLAMRQASGLARPTLELARELKVRATVRVEPTPPSLDRKANLFQPRIVIRDVVFTYPDSEFPALVDIDFSIDPGSQVALVGATGSGKSTLADLILGLVTPTSGTITVSGHDPRHAVALYPGHIAYVPQVTVLIEGSLRDNVALGRPLSEVDDRQIMKVLTLAQLGSLPQEMGNGLSSQVAPGGVNLSGGQRQRLGLARALYTNPDLLVLDEATSALDAETEHAIAQALSRLRGSVTLIVIAHRLATVRHADSVVFLDEGRARAIGTFEEVRAAEPKFDYQARLLGL